MIRIRSLNDVQKIALEDLKKGWPVGVDHDTTAKGKVAKLIELVSAP